MRLIVVAVIYVVMFARVANAQFNTTILKPIDAALKINANAVKRLEESELVIQDMEKATFKQKIIYTVLNEKGDRFLNFYEWVDKFKKLDDVTVTFLNGLGLPEKVYRKKDLTKAASQENFVDDYNLYYMRFRGVSYPTHIQIEYTTSYKGILTYPSFDIQTPNESVEEARFTVVVPSDLGIRYFTQNIDIEPEIEKYSNTIKYTWNVKNRASFEEEDGAASAERRYPKVLIAPNQFKMDDYAGNMQSWQSFGEWFGNLSSKSLDLPENAKAEIRSLVANFNDPKEKTKILYQHLQDNFRYVSIQLGIGGFKPFPASFTETKKYGDCEALSNLMKAYLDAVGIKSHLALINAGINKAPVHESFPVDQFNHVILCVPFDKDSVWLECTSNYTDFNKLGNFTENRKALLITPNGGMLVNTPASEAALNTFSTYTTVIMKDDGSGTFQTKLYSSGEFKFRMVNWMHNESQKDQQDALLGILQVARPARFSVQWKDDIRSEIMETGIEMMVEKVPAIKAGPRMFLNKRAYSLAEKSLPRTEKRIYDYYFSNAYIKSDTTVYQLPAGFEVASLPKDVHLTSKYASYDSQTKQDQQTGNIVTISVLRLNNHVVPAADFIEMKKFVSDVIEDETQKIAISRQ